MSEPKIAETDEGYRKDVAAYRAPAVSAIVTLVLGILSFVALFHPTAWVFPLTTIAVGFAALYALAKNPLKIGRKAALIGLTLAFFFLACAGSHYFSRQRWLARYARQYADAWFELVCSGQLRDAHQLRLPEDSRVEPGTDMNEYYTTHSMAQADFDRFYAGAPLTVLRRLGPSAKVVFERAGSYEQLLNRDKLYLDYRADYQQNGQPKQLPMQIIMVRERNRATGEFDWHVDSVNSPTAGR